jgi:hypothetical protein
LSKTQSSANLADEHWTITNPTHNIVTEGLWLDSVLLEHTHQIAQLTADEVHVLYQLDGVDIDGDVQEVRSVVQCLQEAYRVAKNQESTTRPERYALLQRLADNRVMPSEMTVILGVDLSIAERFAGNDHEARIARSLLHQIRTV